MEIRAYQWRNGVLISEEENALTMTLYFTNELLLMLERAGLVDVVVHGDHAPARAERRERLRELRRPETSVA